MVLSLTLVVLTHEPILAMAVSYIAAPRTLMDVSFNFCGAVPSGRFVFFDLSITCILYRA